MELSQHGILWAMVAVCFGWAWFMSRSESFRFNIDHIHHYYYGWALAAYGWILHCTGATLWAVIVCGAVGILLTADDVYQHRRQAKEPKYHSPIHNLIYLIY